MYIRLEYSMNIANTLKLFIVAIFAIGIASTTTATTTLAQNQTETQSNQTSQVITLLDDAEVNIDQARDLIRGLQAQVSEIAPEPTTDQGMVEEVEIVTEANESAEDIVEIIETEVTNESETVNEVSNATDDVVEIVEGSVESNATATPDVIANASDTLVEIIEETIDPIDNSSAEVHTQSALIRLLIQLVVAQDYNQNLSEDEKAELQTLLQETIVEQATSLAQSLGN